MNNNKTVLITGMTGFVGSWLADYIIENHPNIKILGLVRWRSPMDNIKHIIDKITIVEGDLTDPHSLRSILSEYRPDIIFHLAAQSYVQYSFNAPVATLEANTIGTLNLLEEIRQLKLSSGYDPIVHVCSSSEVYGDIKTDEIPIKETNQFRPASPYAVSKVGEDMLAYQYWLSWGIKTIRTRMFTHCLTGDMPVIIRKNDIIDILPIEDIVPHRTDSRQPKYVIEDIDNSQFGSFDVWDRGGWTKVLRMEATWNGYLVKGRNYIKNKPVYRISARGAIFQVTGDHIVFVMDENVDDVIEIWDRNSKKDIIIGRPAWEIDLKKKPGDCLALIKLPEPTDKTILTEEEAWFIGAMVSDGYIGLIKNKIYDSEALKGKFSNKDTKLIDVVKNLWYKLTGGDTSIYIGEKDVYDLRLLGNSNYLRYIQNEIYTREGHKKIPKRILNAPSNIRLAFLRGYNAGDGTKSHSDLEWQEFTTESACLASGLYWLTLNTLNRRSIIHDTILRDKVYYKISINASDEEKTVIGPIKPLKEITRTTLVNYKGWLYDFTTETGTFNAGIGQGWIHNSGPRRGDVFAESSFAKQIAAIEAGVQPPVVKVGNLDSIRTFLDVKDAVRAYWILVNKPCTFGDVYNIGGIETMTVGDMLNKLLKLSTMKDIKIEVGHTRLRPSDVTLQIPSIEKFTKETGWKPEIPFDKTLEDLLNYWRTNDRHNLFER